MTNTTVEQPQELDLPLPIAQDFTVLARTPDEMAVAQQQLQRWATGKLEALQLALQQAETNLEIAKEKKWRSAGFQAQVRTVQKNIIFYTKIRAAIAAGYCIVPDFPGELIAIRTTALGPKGAPQRSRYGQPDPLLEATNTPPLGEGENVSPVPAVARHTQKLPEGHNKELVDVRFAEPIAFQEFDFPMKLVKPQILDDTARALAAKIFDEICILPASRRTPDPIVYGRVVFREGRLRRRAVAFMISWWLDTNTL